MKVSHWLIALTAAGVVACSDGPAEDAGEEVDEAVEDVTGEASDTFEEAGEEIDEATDDEPMGDETMGDEPMGDDTMDDEPQY